MRLPNNIVLYQEGAALSSKDLKKFVIENNPRLGIVNTKVDKGNFILEYEPSNNDLGDSFKTRQSKIASVLYMIQAEVAFNEFIKRFRNGDW